jgi:hypothetical protein
MSRSQLASGKLAAALDDTVGNGGINGLGMDQQALARRTRLCLPAQLPIESWRRIGEQIFVISDSSAWWMGDWLIYGEKRYPDRYKKAMQGTSLDYQTLRNYAWVARRFESSRRRDKLSFQHHVEVSALPVNEQNRWLDDAERNGWSRNQLRSRLRASLRDAEAEPETKAVLHMNLDPEQMERWQAAADKAKCQLPDWIAFVLDDAASAALTVAQAG